MHEFVESARRETGDSTVVSFLTASLIAAAAVRLHIPVATLNDKHFRSIPSVKVIRPY